MALAFSPGCQDPYNSALVDPCAGRMVGLQAALARSYWPSTMSVGSDAMLCAAPSILSSNSDLESQDVFGVDNSEPMDFDVADTQHLSVISGNIENHLQSVIASHGLEDTFYVMDIGVLKQLYLAWKRSLPRVEVRDRQSGSLSDSDT